jgi:hypothetical protein
MQQADIDEYSDALNENFDQLIDKFKAWIGLNTEMLLTSQDLSEMIVKVCIMSRQRSYLIPAK